MATIRVAIDNIQNKTADQKTLDTFAQKLREAGHTVTTHGIDPNRIQETMLKPSNKCDVMIQVAGGKCLGTLVDFYMGLGRYYHADAGGFAYFKCWDPNWKSHRSGDDGFSKESNLRPYKGKTLPTIFEEMRKTKKMYYGYGDTAEACAKTFLESMGGGTASTGTTGATGGGSNLLDIIKEICSDNNPRGPELTLTGDTVNIRRSSPQYATPLTEHQIVRNSVTFNEYDNDTPNTWGKAADSALIRKFGKIPLETDISDSWQNQVLLMGQRNHGHSIDLKVLVDPRFVPGQWVRLYLPRYNINGRLYYITKCNYNEARVFGLTLEPGPPELYVDVQEVVEEPVTDEEETTEEE